MNESPEIPMWAVETMPPREPRSLVRQPADLLSVIAAAVADPRMDVAKMERLLAMHREITAENRRIQFVEAMARLAPKLPEIDKRGHVEHEARGGRVDRKYARLEDIDRAIKPLYTAEGFSLMWNTGEGAGGKVRIIGTLSHSGGHSTTLQIDMPHDTTGSKNATQAVASTISYGKRILTKNFFNLVEKGEDIDGENLEAITEEQVKDLEALLTEVGLDRGRFMVFMGVGELKDILAKDWKKALNGIDVKRRGVK